MAHREDEEALPPGVEGTTSEVVNLLLLVRIRTARPLRRVARPQRSDVSFTRAHLLLLSNSLVHSPCALVDVNSVEGEGRGRGRGRGRGGERSDRGDRGRGVRRPFDRHSATGKVYVFFFLQNFCHLMTYMGCRDSEKKVHQGWGGDDGNSELKVEAAAETDAQVESFGAVPSTEGWGPEPTSESWAPAADATTAENGAPAAEGEKPEGRQRREREPEEEDNTLTLEEYLKQQKEKELEVVPQLETRKANEGDDSIWKDAVAVTKKDEEESAYFVGKVGLNLWSYVLHSAYYITTDQG